MREKTAPSTNGEKKLGGPQTHVYHPIENSKQTKVFDEKPETIKILEENIDSTLQHIGSGIRPTTEKGDFIKYTWQRKWQIK